MFDQGYHHVNVNGCYFSIVLNIRKHLSHTEETLVHVAGVPKGQCVPDCNFVRVTTSAKERAMVQMQFQATYLGFRTCKNAKGQNHFR